MDIGHSLCAIVSACKIADEGKGDRKVIVTCTDVINRLQFARVRM